MKKHSLAFLTLLSFTTFAVAQNSIKLGVDYFPNYSIHTNADPIVENSREGKVSFSLGITAAKNISDRLSIHTGLYYANVGTQNTVDDLRWGLQHDGQGGFNPDLDTGDDIDDITYRNSLQFVEIPLKARYVILDKGWQLYVSQAIIGRYFINERQKVIVNREDQHDTRYYTINSTYNSISPALQSAIGIAKPIGKQISLYLEPRCQFNFMVMQNEILAIKKDVHFFSIGLGTGILFGF
jgi:hypothetical protein